MIDVELKAGQELDDLIIKHIIGPENVKTVWDGNCHRAPSYSRSIEAAWEVVEKFNCIGKKGIRWWKLEQQPTGEYHIMLRDYAQNGEISYYAESDTAAHAICLAALKAKGLIQ